MKQYEFKMLHTLPGDPPPIDELNEEGKEGWALAGIFKDHCYDQRAYILQRKLTKAPK